MEREPIKEQVRRTLEASQDVYPVPGRPSVKVWIRNFEDDGGLYFPETGGWRSFAEIKKELAEEIRRKYPPRKYPLLKLGKISLSERNEEDRMYLKYVGEYES